MLETILNKQINKNIIEFPKYSYIQLNSGNEIYHLKKDKLPISNIKISFDISPKFEDDNHAGIMKFISSLLMYGAGEYNKYELDDQLSFYGITISPYITKDKFYLSVNTLSEYIDKAFYFIKLILTEPHFDINDIQLAKENLLKYFEHFKIDNNILLSAISTLVMYKNHQSYRNFLQGFANTVDKFDENLIKNYYKNYFTNTKYKAVITTDLSTLEIENLFNKYLNFNPNIKNPEFDFDLNKLRNTLYIVHKPEAVQADILISNYTTPYNAKNYFAKNIFNRILGSSFNSRLNTVIREKIGATYGISSSFSHQIDISTFNISTSIENEKLNLTFKILIDEFEKVKKNITIEEFEKSKEAYYYKYISFFDKYKNITNYYTNIAEYNLSNEYIANIKEYIFNITLDNIYEEANNLLNENKVFFIVGDAEKIKKNVADFNFDIKEVDREKIIYKGMVEI